jgi:hypothetical protein
MCVYIYIYIAGAKDFSVLQNLQIDSGAIGAYYLIPTRVPSQGQRGQGVQSTTHLQLVPKFKTSTSIDLFPLYFFMKWKDKTLR